MKRFRGCLSVIGIFLFGVIFGAIVATSVVREKIRGIVDGGPAKVVEVIVSHLKDDLHLDHDQEEMLHQIALETQIQLGSIRQQTQPQVARTLDEATRKVRGILKPEQVKKFDEIVGKARADWKTEPVVPATPNPAASATPPPAERKAADVKASPEADHPPTEPSPPAPGEGPQ